MSTTLAHNPVCKPAHYQFYFGVSRRTATRYYATDKAALGRCRLTYMDFFRRYDAFPDPQFRPKWIETECAKMRQNAPK
ncbi:hypothetical protein SAMN04488132_11712 [Sediminibacterium ginsengisoli]|uniref:Uncharacterized protein n=1 Tax=Sediminibacterium ginsengisoli TaxID=413434 RepID=A0A1T4RZD8_9BACT|nr:hypothetical protein SAMN04488132_11712 [Sediminibacterium ginsengisoli]